MLRDTLVHFIHFGTVVDPVRLATCAALRNGMSMTALAHPLPIQVTDTGIGTDLAWLMATALHDPTRETFVSAGFDRLGRILFLKPLGFGGRRSCPLDGRRLLALLSHGDIASIVIAHNHPSGNPAPSAEDIALTARIVAVARFAGVDVHDHLIFAGETHSSFRNLSLL